MSQRLDARLRKLEADAGMSELSALSDDHLELLIAYAQLLLSKPDSDELRAFEANLPMDDAWRRAVARIEVAAWLGQPVPDRQELLRSASEPVSEVSPEAKRWIEGRGL
jgi:trehalose-6-phosphate synthase